MSRAKTAEEVREELLDHVRTMVDYWDKTERDKKGALSGLAFSILTMIDGAAELPAFDLVCRPHPDDEAFHKSEDEDWYPDGMVVNECMLHDLFYKKTEVNHG
jgi:hypothetical protein